MNELLQRHGCSNVFTIPEGLKELMADISREVLRDQPAKIFDYIANYLSVLLITREHGILSVKILDDLCDCRPSVAEHLQQLGMVNFEAELLAQVIKEEIEGLAPEEGKEKVKEIQILKKVLARTTLDEEMAARVCQVARNAYRDYWYRKQLMQKNLKVEPYEPWEVAAKRTLELYKRTKPSYSELTRATRKIQAAYRGYHVRRNLLRHLKPKKAKRPKIDIPGPPLDFAGSREIDLGPVINVRAHHEDTTAEFDKEVGKSLNVGYDPMMTITHVVMPDEKQPATMQLGSRSTGVVATKSIVGPAKSEVRKFSFKGVDQPDPLEELPYNLPHMDNVSKSEIRASSTKLSENKIPGADVQAKSRTSPEMSQQWNKISFSERHQERIIDDDIQEKPHEKTQEMEVPEEIPAAEPTQEDAQEVPEDIPEVRTDGDSAPEANDSAPEAYDSAAEAVDSAAEAVDSAAEAVDSAAEADDSAEECDVTTDPSAPATDVDDAGATTGEEEE